MDSENKAEETNGQEERPLLDRAAREGRATEDEQLLSASKREATFTDTDPWRVLRIMSEFVRGFDTLADIQGAVTLFGSARTAEDDPDYQAAVDVARLLGEVGFDIITGGGPGIMQAGNKGAMEAGVRSIGLNIELPFEQHINPYVDLSVDYRYFFVRKTMLVKYSQAFVIFPGGFGTMDELFEALTLIQTGKIHDFPVVLFDSQYWQGLIDWLRQTMLSGGKIAEADLDLLIVTDSPAEVRDIIVRAADERQKERERAARSVTREVYRRRNG